MGIFINNDDVTLCSMSELLSQAMENQSINNICEENGLNINLLGELFRIKAKGYNNLETAKKLGVHRVTIQRYAKALQNLKKVDFVKLYNFIVRDMYAKND